MLYGIFMSVMTCLCWGSTSVMMRGIHKLGAFEVSLLRAAGGFFAMRLVSLGMETVLMFLLVEVLHLNDLAMKLLVNIVVIILNYVFSKLFIFKKK